MTSIKAAAVLHNGEVWTGHRHAEIMRAIWAKHGAVQISQEAQGFVTDDGKFVGREEAARIALLAGQIQKEKSELFSEDVFPKDWCSNCGALLASFGGKSQRSCSSCS
jgi:hypothetical protein